MCSHSGRTVAGQVNRPILRQVLTNALRTDAELGAFCLDHFPSTYALFSQGMNREEKLNLLLEREHPYSIAKRLPSPTDDIFDQGSKFCTGSCDHNEVAKKNESLILKKGAIAGLAILSIIILSITSVLITRNPKALDESTTEELASDLVLLSSMPSGAEVWDLRTGHRLGKTPMRIARNSLPRQVCLKQPGWTDEMLTLRAEQKPLTPIILRPQNSSAMEACNVPIPILR